MNRNIPNDQSDRPLRTLPFLLPPLPEQRAIAGLLDRVDESIERVRDEREALQSLKASTADALLTGQVRVADYQSHAYLTERV